MVFISWNAEFIVVQDKFFDIAYFVKSLAADFLDMIITKINNLEYFMYVGHTNNIVYHVWHSITSKN